MRDGLSLLDQCASATTGELTAERVYACLGIAGIQECGQIMGHIADHDTKNALSLLNRFYAEGKDMGALLDELACLTRDLLVMKTAPQEGISMLSGVASDQEVSNLTGRFSTGELIRMMNVIQQTVAGFTRSASRRMDAEMCIVNLCQPELTLDAAALNARLTRLEDKINSGNITVRAAAGGKKPVPADMDDEERPPLPDDADAPPGEEEPAPVVNEAPVGFWADVASAVRKELKPPVSGFFAPTPSAPVQGILQGDKLILECANSFAMDCVNKPEVLAVVAQKASAKLGRQIRVVAVDKSVNPKNNAHMEQLLSFGRAHGDIVKIKPTN